MPCTCPEGMRGSDPGWGDCSASRPGCFTSGKTPQFSLTGRLGGTLLTFCSCQELNHDFSNVHDVDVSLHELSCPVPFHILCPITPCCGTLPIVPPVAVPFLLYPLAQLYRFGSLRHFGHTSTSAVLRDCLYWNVIYQTARRPNRYTVNSPVSFFDLFLTVHLNITLANNQLDAQILNTFTTILYVYMFRAISCSSSGGQIILTL